MLQILRSLFWDLYTAEGKVPALFVQKAHQGSKLFLLPEAKGTVNPGTEVTTDSLSHLQSAQGHLMEHVRKEQTSFQLIILFARLSTEKNFLCPENTEPKSDSPTIKLFISYMLP